MWGDADQGTVYRIHQTTGTRHGSGQQTAQTMALGIHRLDRWRHSDEIGKIPSVPSVRIVQRARKQDVVSSRMEGSTEVDVMLGRGRSSWRAARTWQIADGGIRHSYLFSLMALFFRRPRVTVVAGSGGVSFRLLDGCFSALWVAWSDVLVRLVPREVAGAAAFPLCGRWRR